MYYIDFNEISDKHLEGEWRVQTRTYGKSNIYSLIALAEKHNFLKNGIYSVDSIAEPGSWSIKRNDQLLSRPFIAFEISGEKNAALITRLSYTPNKSRSQLNIYFSTGLELILVKD